MNEGSKSKTLGAFLKSRREKLQPEQAGVHHSYGHRRTPGLRREEVAMLAGVSATYYTWLEQGREVTASRDIIENIARALQLTPDERMHLLQLWDPNGTGNVSPVNRTINPQWKDIIEQLPYPAFITNQRTEVLAWNDRANEVLADFASMEITDLVMLRIFFLDTDLRRRLKNWEEFALHSVAVFRTYYDKHHLEDPWFDKLVEQLLLESAEFKSMWELHQIQQKTVNRVVLQIPGKEQPQAYDINSFTSIVDHPDLQVCIYSPV